MQSEAYNKFLLSAWNSISPKQYYLDIDYKSIPELQSDNDKLSVRLQSEIKRGMITPKNAAQQLNYPEITDPLADQLWIGTDMIPMNQAGNKPVVPPKQITG